MKESTQKIIDNIIQQWCDDKIYINIDIDGQTGIETLYILKNIKDQKNLKRRLSDRFADNKKQKPENLICRIDIIPNASGAYIYFKSCYSIDKDFSGVHKYIEPFIAVIKSKIRQINSAGIQVKLGMISLKKFDQASNSFTENKDQIIKEIYKDIKKEELKQNKK